MRTENVTKTSSMTEPFENAVSQAVEKGRETFSRVVDKVGPAAEEGYHQVEKALEDVVDMTTKNVKKYPVQSLLIGFGVGCLFGLAVFGFRHFQKE